MNRVWWLLIAILILAAGLRLYQLGELPVVLNRDEAALAYNAKLLLLTGQDEWGRSWPLSLESFGDYKLPGYVFVLVGFMQWFGQDEWVVRLPAALAGIWLVVMAYLLARQLRWKMSEAVMVAGLVAVTPVFIFFSRMAWEATLGTAWLVTALYLWWVAPQFPRRVKLIDSFAGMCLLFAVFTYNIPFIVLPGLVPLLILQRGWKKTTTWWWPLAWMVGILILAGWTFIPLTTQKSGITLFSDPTVYAEWILFRSQLSGVGLSLLGSRYLYLATRMIQNTVATFSPHFLTQVGGTHPWHQVPGTAHLYWVVYGFGLLGIVNLVKQLVRLYHQKKWSIWQETIGWWYILGLSLLPAIITVDAPHATRSLWFFFIWMFLAVQGWRELALMTQKLLHQKLTTAVAAVAIALLVIEASIYIYTYFNLYPTRQAALKPGLSQVLEETKVLYPDRKVAIVDPDGYSYILVAWYDQITPQVYFSTIIRQQPDRIGFRYGQQLERYHFVAKAEDRENDESVIIEWVSDVWQIRESK